jgi:hypothetical protein
VCCFFLSTIPSAGSSSSGTDDAVAASSYYTAASSSSSYNGYKNYGSSYYSGNGNYYSGGNDGSSSSSSGNSYGSSGSSSSNNDAGYSSSSNNNYNSGSSGSSYNSGSSSSSGSSNNNKYSSNYNSGSYSSNSGSSYNSDGSSSSSSSSSSGYNSNGKKYSNGYNRYGYRRRTHSPTASPTFAPTVDVLYYKNLQANNSEMLYYQSDDEHHRSHRSHHSKFVHSSQHQQQQQQQYYYTDLGDVWMCLGIALGWTVWMLSSFIRDDLHRYQKHSIVVRGHVLHVSVEDDSMGMGIPTYKAVIDYMVPPDNAIQIRKHFETQHLLQEGFANVELLVLPTEPTHSVLKEDWQKEFEEQIQEERTPSCYKSSTAKRVSVAFAGLLVMVSVSGGLLAAHRMHPNQRRWGWISVCIGATLLLPAAIFIHRLQVAFARLLDDTEKTGIYIRGSTSQLSSIAGDPVGCCDQFDVLDARACDSEETTVPVPSTWNMPDNACYFVQLPPQLPRSDGSHTTHSTVSSISVRSQSGVLLLPLDETASV